MTLTREYNFPVEQFPDTTFDSVTLCEEELDELSGKSVMSDSVAQGLEVTVETIYTCK